MNRERLILLIIFFSGILVGCGGEREELDGFVSLTNNDLGLTVSYPEEWVTDAVELEMILASDGAVIIDSDYTGAAAVILFVEPVEKVGADLLTFMETELVGEQAVFVVEQPTKTTINGLDAATFLMAQPQGDLDLFLGTTLIQKDEQIAFVLTIYDSDVEASFAPILDQIVHSVQFVTE
ncbi:MAG: hypothetical protein GY943_24935 [Chloroflexi bacterium]|nr:hypothetical protein [Chloroflexota bacterium]